MKQFDVAVIGAGPAGQRAAIQAAKLGASVVVIERLPTVGGAAINGGTIPSKALREAVLYLTGFRERELYGVSYSVKQDILLQDLTYRLDHILRREVAVMESQLARNGVEVMFGRASFSGDHRLVIDRGHEKSEIVAENVILAPGSKPAHSEQVPIDGVRIFDTDQILNLREIPRRLAVIGAGVVGLEYACMFAALGVRVTLVEKQEQLIPFVDREIVEALIYHMRDTGVLFQLGEGVDSVTIEGDEVVATTESRKRVCADALLYTIGRVGSTDQLGLENIGLGSDDRGRLTVDDRYRTSVPYVYAAGDVIGFPALASSSMEQGRIAARNALGAPTDGVQDPLPFGIYTIPEISIVGKTEPQLTRDRVPYEIGLARYSETARGQIVGDSTGRLKLLVHTETREILGVHIIGEGASELIHIGQTVIALNGKLDYLVNNVFNYPTLAECYKVAALDAYNKISGYAVYSTLRQAA
ncbi:MAG: Si-specific NAD(P)(+) transhydrogenase [Dehalococcoidia bacterium]|jgi:NAD(P) transhydrogenase|nr:Si-specific NAD(P)(+) transhydrogenase [Dehalococcoidia bacterium]